MPAAPRLILASRSPRRRELLARLGCRFEIVDPEVAEVRAPGETAVDYVQRVAAAKAEAGWIVLGADAALRVLGADTEVVLRGEVFGMPADAAAARAMLRRLSGREHEVLSAVCLRGATGARTALVTSTVRFERIDDALLEAYVASGEPFGKAGGYAIQGYAERFVMRLCGSYSGVMGLPLAATARLLEESGLRLPPPA